MSPDQISTFSNIYKHKSPILTLYQLIESRTVYLVQLFHYYYYNTVTESKNRCANSRAESAFNQLELFTVLSKQFLIDKQNACLGRKFDFFSISECFQYTIIGKHLNVFPSLMSGPPMHHVRHTHWQHQPHKSGNKVYPCKPFSFYLLSNKIR